MKSGALILPLWSPAPQPWEDLRQASLGIILCSFYVGPYLALGSHSPGRGRGQSPDLGPGRSWRNIPQQGLGRPSESRLNYSGQRRPCPQAWGWEASGQ